MSVFARLLRTKSLSTLDEEATAKSGLLRTLTSLDLVALVGLNPLPLIYGVTLREVEQRPRRYRDDQAVIYQASHRLHRPRKDFGTAIRVSGGPSTITTHDAQHSASIGVSNVLATRKHNVHRHDLRPER